MSSSSASHAPPSLPRRESDIKHLVELLCHRLYYYMQRDNIDKRLRKMRNELDYCRPGYPETSNHANVLTLQIEQTTQEKSKCCEKLTNADQKLLTYVVPFMDKYGETLLSMRSGIESERVDARLKTACGRLQDQIISLIKEGSATSTQFEKEATKAKVSREEGKEKIDRLQQRLDELERKVNNLDKTQASETQRSTQTRLKLDAKLVDLEKKLDQLTEKIEDVAKSTISSDALSTALTQLDINISASETAAISEQWGFSNEAGMRTRRRIQALFDDLDKIKLSLQSESADKPPCILDLQDTVNSCFDMVRRHVEKHISTPEDTESAKGTLTQLVPAHSSSMNAPSLPDQLSVNNKTEIDEIFDQKFQPLSASLQENMKSMMHERLKQVVQDLGSFIDKERIQRANTSSKAEELSASLESLRQNIDKFNLENAASIGSLDQKFSQLSQRITMCNDGLASIDSRLTDAAKESKENVEKLEMQVQVVNTWQSNFTTKPLYQDIANHIVTTLPSNITQKITLLTSRLDAVEENLRVRSDETPKRRKTAHK